MVDEAHKPELTDCSNIMRDALKWVNLLKHRTLDAVSIHCAVAGQSLM